jgi:hypothetical protein
MAGFEFVFVVERQQPATLVKPKVVLMDSRGSSPVPGEQAAKKAYSAPQLTDLGAIEQLALGGSGAMMENMPGGPNMTKRP